MINRVSCSTTNIIEIIDYKGEISMADIRDEINLCEGIQFNKENIEVEKVQVQDEVKKEKQQMQTQEKQVLEQQKVQAEQEQEKQQQQVPVQVSNGENLPIKQGLWERFKAFWFEKIDWNKEIKIELTPHQQKVENEINEFLHQEVTWKKIHDLLFKKNPFGKKKAEV